MAPPARLLVAACCLLVALLCQTVSATPNARHLLAAPNWGQDPSVSTCRLDATWVDLIAREREGTGNAFKTASLGVLEASPRYQVWLCEEGHACANGTSSYFCFVFDEVLKVFVPWGPNSQLLIVANSGWNTAYFSAAYNFSAPWYGAASQECTLDEEWPALHARAETVPPQVFVGGLGRMMTTKKFEVFACDVAHPCAGPGDAMCFVFNEETRRFLPWGRNTDLRIIRKVPFAPLDTPYSRAMAAIQVVKDDVWDLKKNGGAGAAVIDMGSVEAKLVSLIQSHLQADAYQWLSHAPGACNVSCGGGYLPRYASCIRWLDGTQVDNSLCATQNKPATLEPCFASHGCGWQLGDFGACSTLCGSGTRRQPAQCFAFGSTTPVSPDFCTSEDPSVSEPCESVAGCTFEWKEGPWGACSTTCGSGTHARLVTCPRSDGVMVSVGQCAALGQAPPSSEACTSAAGCSDKIVNECAAGSHTCAEDALCTDEVNGYTCACNPGFLGSGYLCVDADECVIGSHNCADNAANCVNLVGSYRCDCPPGTHSTNGGFPCVACPVGTAATSVDASDCSICAANFFGSPTDACQPCPVGATSATGSTLASNCVCGLGFTGNIATTSDTCAIEDLSSWTLRGSPGLSCDSVCGSVGKTCVPGLLDQVDTSEEVEAVSQASMRAIFDLEGEGTGLYAHYRASSFDDITKVWSDVSGNSRGGQAVSLSAPARELSASGNYYSWDTTFALTADGDAWFSFSYRFVAGANNYFDLRVGDTTERVVLDQSRAVDEGNGCLLHSVMDLVKLPRAAYSTGSLKVQIVNWNVRYLGSVGACSGRSAMAKVVQYSAGDSSASAVVSSGHTSSVTSVTGGARDILRLARLPATFTICSVSRYENATHSDNTVLGALAPGASWYHGHSAGTAGVFAYSSAAQGSAAVSLPPTDWLVMCGQNAGEGLVLANGVPAGYGASGLGDLSLVVNNPLSWTTPDADSFVGSAWSVSEVAIWGRALTRAEMEAVSAHLLLTLAEGRDTPFNASLCPGGVSSSSDVDAPFLSPSGACFFRNGAGVDCSAASFGRRRLCMCAAPCAADFYGTGTECTACPPGSDSSAGTETAMGCACPGSAYLAGPGDAGGSWRCAACPPNSFSPLGSLSAADCLCNSGLYSSGSGADVTCAACPAGSVSPGGSSDAGSCQCLAGTFGAPHIANCTSCPAHSTSAEGSTVVEDCVCLWGFGVAELGFSRRITSPSQTCEIDGLEFGGVGLSCSEVCTASGRACVPFPTLGRDWLEAAVEAKDVSCSSMRDVSSVNNGESSPFAQNPSDGSCYFNTYAGKGVPATCSSFLSTDRRFCVCGCPRNHYGSGASCTPCPAGSTAPAGSKLATECICRPPTYGEISAAGSGTCTNCTEGTAVASFRIEDTFSASSSDLHGWEGSTEISQCGGLGAILGGYAQLGRASFLRKTVTGLCSHNEVWLSFSLVGIDGWVGQDAILYADGVEVWRRSFSFSGASSCGGSGAEGSISGGIVLSHSARALTVELRTTLSAEVDVVSWGLESFAVYADCAGDSAVACEPIVATNCVPVLESYGSGTCGLTLDGVVCWGSSYFSTIPSGKAVAIAVGGDHALVVRSDGSLEGYGYGYYGAIGGGTGIIDLGGLKAVAVAAGISHTVVLMQDGSVRAFGWNAYGQLGLGDTQQRGGDPAQMGANLPAVALGANLSAVAVAAGWAHTCVIVNTGTLKCAGFHVAFGGRGSNLLEDVNLSGLSAVAVSLVSSRTVVLLADGSVRTFGWGCGGDEGCQPGAVDLGGGRAKAIAAGSSHTVVLMQDGSVRAFGSNQYGKLGLGDTDTRGDNPEEMGTNLPPVDLGGLRAEAISAGSDHTCAALEDRTVRCWGRNSNGQLGSSSFSSRGHQPDQMGSSIPSVPLSSPLLKCGV